MLERLKEETLEAMLKKVKKMRAFELLDEIPGAGPVIAIGYIAMIITPERFSRKNKLWRYACLGNTRHESDDVVYKDRPSSSGNRVLKWVVVQHYQGAVERSKKLNRFKRRHQELLARGLSWKAARRHVCRNILSVVRAVWMKEEPYRDK
jgi:transposase